MNIDEMLERQGEPSPISVEFGDAQIEFVGWGASAYDTLYIYVLRDGVIINEDGSAQLPDGVYMANHFGLFKHYDPRAAFQSGTD